MSFHRVFVEEARLRIGTEVVFLNALHGVRSVHEGEGDAAYEDSDRRVRVSPYAVLQSPKRVCVELMRLSRGRWTTEDVAMAVQQAERHIRGRLPRQR